MMKCLHDPTPGAPFDRVAVVMLPGAGDRAQDLVEHGFVRALRDRGIAAGALAVDARFDDYLESSVVEQLEEGVIGPARRGGCLDLWILGISLGGYGALSYARTHPGSVAGVVLLAPFLGTRGLVAEAARAGGLRDWEPGAVAHGDADRELLAWLRGYRAGGSGFPPVYLGYGAEDRYAPASALLAAQLPPGNVLVIPGGHDWDTWLRLWTLLLDRVPLGGKGLSVSAAGR